MVRENDMLGDDMVKDKILLHIRIIPPKVTLPEGRTFYTRYQRVGRKNLPVNVTIKKVTTVGPHRQQKQKQQGAGLSSSVQKLLT